MARLAPKGPPWHIDGPDSLRQLAEEGDLPEGTPLLMGGFEEMFPEAMAPVSAALQLNADLGDLSQEELLTFSRAELMRLGAQSFRSYTVEPDTRLAVISRDPEALQDFLETWAGVLEITPILEGGSRPDMITGREIEFTAHEDSVTIRLREPAPIELEKCTYCGMCAPSCPQECIGPEPFIDLDRCNLCGECISACPEGAIDLHGVIERGLTLPFLVLLDGPETRKLADGRRIFTADDMPGLFRRLFPVQVEEVISHNHLLCQYSPRLQTGCRRCLSACMHGGLRLDEGGIELDHTACMECGACVATCPTGAIQYERFTDQTFFSFTRAIEGLIAGRKIVIGSSKALKGLWWQHPKESQPRYHALFIEHPQPAALSPMNFLALFACGAQGVTVIFDSPAAQIPKASAAAIGEAAQIVSTLTGWQGPIRVSSTEEAQKGLGPLAKEAGKRVSEDVINRSCPGLAAGFSGRRALLARILTAMMEQGAQKTQETGAKRLFEEQPEAPYQDLELNGDRCTQCLACINECRSGALDAREDEMSLLFEPALCVACGICTEICPEKALSQQPGLKLSPQFFERRRLFHAEPARCSMCGKVFGTKKSLQRVMSLLADRADLDQQLFSLCEECRVKRMFSQLSAQDMDEQG